MAPIPLDFGEDAQQPARLPVADAKCAMQGATSPLLLRDPYLCSIGQWRVVAVSEAKPYLPNPDMERWYRPISGGVVVGPT